MNVNKEMNSVVNLHCLNANTTENPHDEPAIQLSWDEYACGILILMENVSVYLFAHDEGLQAMLLMYWSEIEMNRIAAEVYEEEGLAGLISICSFFLERCAEQIAQTFEALSNEATA